MPLLARVARVFVEGRASVQFGHVDLGDFSREFLGRSSRWLRDLSELGAGLERLAGLEAALVGSDGGPPLGRVAARCIARTASAETLSAWVGLARRVSVRELLEAARAARRASSDRPLDGQAQTPSGSNGEFVPTGAVEEEDSDELLAEVCLELPVPLDVAVDEGRDLHRAAGGRETNLAGFVEALVGEAFAGPHPPDAELVQVKSCESRALREMLLARLNAGWNSLDEGAAARPNGNREDPSEGRREEPSSGALEEPSGKSKREPSSATEFESEIAQVLEQVVSIESAVAFGMSSAVVAGWQLWDLVQIEDRLERLLGRALHAMGRHGDWSQLGFTGVGHYAEQRLGMGRRTAESRAAIVGALKRRPAIQAAYASGAIGLESAWLLVRVLGRGPVEPEIEAAWVNSARGMTVKRLRDELRRARLASCGVLGPPEPQATRISDLEALPTSAFESRPIPRTLRPVVPLPATDAEWQSSLRRWPGMTRERVWRLGTHALEAPGAVVFRRFRLPQDLAGLFLSAIESERRRLEEEAHQTPWTKPWPDPLATPAKRAAQEYANRLRRVPAWVGLLSLLEDFVRTWDDPKRIPDRRWKRIYERENYRCAAPGCTRSADIQDHHIDYRSDMGSDEPWNQVALCAFHHQQGEHGRLARVRGTAPLDLLWRLGVPDLGTWWKNERRIDPRDGNAIDARTIPRVMTTGA